MPAQGSSRIGPPEPQHDVGEHDGDADADKRLAKLLPLHLREDEALHQQSEQADDDEDHREGKNHEPVALEIS